MSPSHLWQIGRDLLPEISTNVTWSSLGLDPTRKTKPKYVGDFRLPRFGLCRIYRQICVECSSSEGLKQQGGWVVVSPFYRRRRAEVKGETRSVFQGGLIAVFSSAACGCELRRSTIGQRRVRPVLVVVPSPQMQLSSGIGEGEEHLHVQALVAQLAVERFDIAVLDRLARAAEVQRNTFL